MIHMRRVMTGISGSSIFETEARTSGKGLSSSLTASKSNSIFIEPSLLSCSNMLGVRLRVVVSGPIVEEGCRFREGISEYSTSRDFSRGLEGRLT